MTDETTDGSSRKPLLPALSRKAWVGIIAGGLVFLALCCGVGLPVWVANKTQQGYELEHALTKSYDDNRNKLAVCIDTAVQAAGYTKEQATQMRDALIAANGGANANALMGPAATPTGFATILVKQMPSLAPYEKAFERGFNATVGCRQGFADYQRVLNGKVEDYKNWKSNPFNVSKLFNNWPSDELVANNGTDEVSGDEAFTRIKNIVTNTGATNAYNTGKYDAPDPFASKQAPAPTPTK